MRKQLWEFTLQELDSEIASAKSILEANDYPKAMADYLAVLQEQREERLIEANILKGSRFAEDVLQVVEPPLED